MEATASSPSFVPRRIGLLQCPNAASLGWREVSDPPSVQPEDAVLTDEANTNNEGVPALEKYEGEEKSSLLTSPTDQEINEPSNVLAEGDAPIQRPSTNHPEDTEALDEIQEEEQSQIPTNYIDQTSSIQELTEDTAPLHVSASLAYDTKCPWAEGINDDAVIDVDRKHAFSAERSQILTITCHQRSTQSTSDSIILVGALSGRARLELLPPLPAQFDPETNHAYPTVSLDVYGYRFPQLCDNSNNQHKDKSITINRPSWMRPLPIAVILHNREPQNEKLPSVLRLRLSCIRIENKDSSRAADASKTTHDNYYSAYPNETYKIALLPPSSMYPGNFMMNGNDTCTILEPWINAVDCIVENICQGHDLKPMNKELIQDLSFMKKNSSIPPNSTIHLAKKPCRVVICGAKGVGKSTFLRYATNRILSQRHCSKNDHDKPSTYPNRVAILDLDCGQPELSPPGMLTLTIISHPMHSDPPVHMVCGGSSDRYGKKTTSNSGQNESDVPENHEAAYFYGEITSKADPDTYLQMATQLVRRYEALLEREKKSWQRNDCIGNNHSGSHLIPLLVNTDGWVKGLGYEILSAIIGVVNPDHIVQIQGSTKGKSFEISIGNIVSEVSPQNRAIHVIPSFEESRTTTNDESNKSRTTLDISSNNEMGYVIPLAPATEHRANRISSYFLGGYEEMVNLRSHVPGENDPVSFHKLKGLIDLNNIISSTLAAMLPYAVPFNCVTLYPPSGLLHDIMMIESIWGVRGDRANRDVLDSLNGAIVGLCCEADEFDKQFADSNAGTNVPVVSCHGLGIIRSIDHIHQIFFVLTPVHPSKLPQVTSFVGGNINLPRDCVYRGAHAESFPYLSCGDLLSGPGFGAEVMKSRNHPNRHGPKR